jgi:hypothetical protein
VALEEKVCHSCWRSLPLHQFGKNGKYLKYFCLTCESRRVRAWYAANREKVRKERNEKARMKRRTLKCPTSTARLSPSRPAKDTT